LSAKSGQILEVGASELGVLLDSLYSVYPSAAPRGNVHVETNVNFCVWSVFPDEHGYLKAHKDDDVVLPCRVTPSATTSVKWVHIEKAPYEEPFSFNIYVDGRIANKLRGRVSINNSAAGDYSLKILNVKDIDAGVYHCFDQQQLKKIYVIYDVIGE